MHRLISALAVVLLATSVQGQQTKPPATLPATTPTAPSVSNLPSAQPAVPVAVDAAKVVWNGSVLSVQSKGDSLRNILRAVSNATGMKITGGVPEEPVYGTYGPGPAQEVLPRLFDGMAVNMMLVNEGASRPKELLLTQRVGAASTLQTRPIAENEQGLGHGRPGFSPSQSQGSSQTAPIAPVETPTEGSNATPPVGDANGQQSPTSVRTPEQIFEELRKRQQQQQGATPQ